MKSAKKKMKLLTVALVEHFGGVVGRAIAEYRQRKLNKIQFLEERKRRLGPVSDDKLVLVDYPNIQDLDPRKWKDQDHYAVLGLVNVRQRATISQIKSAYRDLVLKHHPDKRRRTNDDDSDDYFACIQKAFETLKDDTTRRAYDSVDPNFDNKVPPCNKKARKNFYQVFTPVFDRNQCWSLKENVPYLGDDDSTFEEVNQFYEFWYGFQSWREFSYLDQDKEEGADAMERRYMKKNNRGARTVKKKEESQRLRSLVDNAYACDPRIRRYKEEEKAKRAARKEMQQQKLDKAKSDFEAIKAKEEEEARVKAVEMKQGQVEAKKQKEREKKATKKARKRVLNFCKEKQWFYTDTQEKLAFMDNVHHLCSSLDLMNLTSLNDAIDAEPSTAQQRICAKVGEMVEKRGPISTGDKTSPSSSSAGEKSSNRVEIDWPVGDLQILVKAVNLYPVGTMNRWKKVLSCVNKQLSVKRSLKSCVTRAKTLTKSELKAAEADKVVKKTAKPKDEAKVVKKKRGQTYVGTGDKNYSSSASGGYSGIGGVGGSPWSVDDLQILYKAVNLYPVGTIHRRMESTEKSAPTYIQSIG